MPQLTEQNKKDLEAAFKIFDINADGTISKNELATVMQKLGQNPTNAEIEELIKSMDCNENGRIEYREFCDRMSKRGIKTQEEECNEVRAAFSFIDRDKNGFITAPELKIIVTNFGERMTDEEADAMIAKADTNGDGRINYVEFAKIMTKKQ
ncbi:unnamed protein product [Candidula unifasciata]|uniref:EF-hand domain-containing protein n=1 Tax=Candidula unifasciata TaxID=100452 RepID=A0A8S3YK19_9EUPU|nr:unnamed protein product [Candidula unifasciata]